MENNCEKFLLDLGMTKENIRLRDHDQEELSHYSNATTDGSIQYGMNFSFVLKSW